MTKLFKAYLILVLQMFPYLLKKLSNAAQK